MSIFSMLSLSRSRRDEQMAELLRCLKQAHAMPAASLGVSAEAAHDPAFEAWRDDTARIIADCENAPPPPSAQARHLLDDIRVATSDPRCDTLMAIGFAITLVEERGDADWPPTDRALLLSAVPYGDASHKFLAMEHGVSYDEASFARMFVLLGAQPTPQSAAILCAILYSDLKAEGKRRMAHDLAEEVRRRLRHHHSGA